jgi:hypothetical protein
MNHFFLGIGLSCPRIAKENPLRGAMWSSRSPAALSILICQKTHLIVAPIQSRTLSVSAASVSTSDASSSTSEEGSRWPADARVQSSAEAHSRASPPRRRRPTRAHKPRVENVARRGTLPRCRRRMHQRMLRRWGLHLWRARQADHARTIAKKRVRPNRRSSAKNQGGARNSHRHTVAVSRFGYRTSIEFG